jgi:hypothetical protein
MARTSAIAIAGAHNIILRGSLRGAIVVLPISLEPIIFSLVLSQVRLKNVVCNKP